VIRPGESNKPDLGQPRDALGERPGRCPVRQVGVPEHERGDVHRGEAGAVEERRGAVPEERQGEHGERVEAGRRQRRPPHHPCAAEAGGHTERDADR
jgi:hypothetical protein